MKQVRDLIATVGLCGVLFAAALVVPPAIAAPLAQTEGLTMQSLQNAEYQCTFVEDGTVSLTDGIFRAAAGSDTDEEVLVALGDMVVFGDINGDGVQDAATLLVTNAGGSGAFYDLAAVVDDQGSPRNVATTLLGDGVQVRSLSIRNDQIVVEMITHGPDDAMCCPTLAVTRSYRLAGDRLVAVGPLFPHSDGTAYGYVDITGSWLIDPQFEFATEFAEGMARVTISDKQGFVNQDGEIAIEPIYRYAQNFSEGLALVDRAEAGADKPQWAFIDPQAKVTVDAAQFVAASDFSGGLAAVTNDAKYGFIDNTGKVVIPLEYDFAGRFSEGLAVVTIDEKSGYIDTGGTLVIEPQFDYANDFSEGLAAVTVDGKTGYIDMTGAWVVEPSLDLGYEFSEGLAYVSTDQKTGYIDTTGALVIQGDFSFGYAFSEGLAAVDSGGLLGYIDSGGQLVIEPQFTLASNFKDGIARISLDTTWGCIDPAGNLLFELPDTGFLGGPPPTDVVRYLPGAPRESKKGACLTASRAVPLASAWRCTVNSQIYDPCLLADDAETVVCGMDPVTGEQGFRLELSQPLPKPIPETTAGAQATGLTKDDLVNAEYSSEWAESGVARLKDGTYTEKYEDSATGLVISLTDWVAFGDLNADNRKDAAAILATNGGGSGVFVDLVAILDKNNLPQHVATTPLGDRPVITGLSIADGLITVDMITHGPGDGMCCPTLPISFKFRLEEDRLVQVGETPWLLRLANGVTCALTADVAMAFGDQRVNYDCDNGANLLGDVLPGVPWTATQVTLTQGDRGLVISDTQSLNVAMVWQPTDPKRVIEDIGLSPDQVTLKPGALAAAISGHARPGETFNPNVPPQLNGAPAHLRFSFDNQALPEWVGVAPDLAQILIFPVQPYQDMYHLVGLQEFDQQLELMKSLIKNQPAVAAEPIPILPAIPAVQTFAVQVKYLQFDGGQGVRFVTHYAQDAVPVTNDMVFYTFQGLTDDGKYYISATYPIASGLLPNDYEEANVDENYDVFVQNYDSYLEHTVLALQESSTGGFSPDLAELDALLESLTIAD